MANNVFDDFKNEMFRIRQKQKSHAKRTTQFSAFQLQRLIQNQISMKNFESMY